MKTCLILKTDMERMTALKTILDLLDAKQFDALKQFAEWKADDIRILKHQAIHVQFEPDEVPCTRYLGDMSNG